MLANPTPLALMLPQGLVEGSLEEISSIETSLPSMPQGEVAVVDTEPYEASEMDPLECLVTESHLKSSAMKDEVLQTLCFFKLSMTIMTYSLY